MKKKPNDNKETNANYVEYTVAAAEEISFGKIERSFYLYDNWENFLKWEKVVDELERQSQSGCDIRWGRNMKP